MCFPAVSCMIRDCHVVFGFVKKELKEKGYIPFSDAEALFESCCSIDKVLIKIPEADHNTIFAKGMDSYMKAVKELCEKK